VYGALGVVVELEAAEFAELPTAFVANTVNV
jgi:hypothetical protein